MSGPFLVVEGSEGAGKSTLVAGLAAKLRDRGGEPLLVREPGGTPAAERIRAILLEPGMSIDPVSEMYLFLAARADLVSGVIRPALATGRTVLADRFELSTEAYQCGGRGIDRALFQAANAGATGGLRPSLTLVLDIPTEVGFARVQAGRGKLDRMEQAGAEFHARVAEVFRNATGPGIVHLDASRSPEHVLQSGWEAVERVIRPLEAGRH
jgi:dTMP kinase